VSHYRTRCIVCGKFVAAGQIDGSGRPLHIGCQAVTPDVAIGSISNTWPSLAHFHMNEPEWVDW
jgi:hypothetical protein